jgi:hypothetical protein
MASQTIDESMAQLIEEKRIVVDAATDGVVKAKAAQESVFAQLKALLTDKAMGEAQAA